MKHEHSGAMDIFDKVRRKIGKRKSKKTVITSKAEVNEIGCDGNGTGNENMNGASNGDVTMVGKSMLVSNSMASIAEDAAEIDDDEISRKYTAEELLQIYTEKHADEDRLFREEFRRIASEISKKPTICDIARLSHNKEKNRFRNITTSDEHRVILESYSNEPGCDYINASYIDGHTEKRKFIAAQGPKPNTINDFWRMIWEQRSRVIVMLTDFKENGKVKCERYWPESGSADYGDVTIAIQNFTTYGFVYKTTMLISHCSSDEEPRQLTHIWCPKWPDHGIPKTTTELFRVYGIMMISQPFDSNASIVVHCSAGVGRSGTLIGLDILLDQLRMDKRLDLFGMVVKMRRYRTEMVQGMDQYVFLHKMILEHNFIGLTDCEGAKLKYRLHNFNSLQATDSPRMRNGYQYEFSKLVMFPPLNARPGSGRMAHNLDKNRRQDIVPYEHSQIFIRMKALERRGPYLNASTLQTYSSKYKLIATQAPMRHTTDEFWRAIYDNNVTCVVMLCPLEIDGQEICPMYWPEFESKVIGDITIEYQSSSEHGNFIESTLLLRSSGSHARNQPDRLLTHIHLPDWSTGEDPPCDVIDSILEILKIIDDGEFEKSKLVEIPTIVIHCSDGCGRTGVFCALLNLIERLKWSSRCDVFRAVKDLRDCRPGMINTVQEYKLLYRLIEKYISSTNVDINR